MVPCHPGIITGGLRQNKILAPGENMTTKIDKLHTLMGHFLCKVAKIETLLIN